MAAPVPEGMRRRTLRRLNLFDGRADPGPGARRISEL